MDVFITQSVLGQADAVSRLIRNEPLRPGGREIIHSLGFGSALVSSFDDLAIAVQKMC
jgi:hypothetical protein